MSIKGVHRESINHYAKALVFSKDDVARVSISYSKSKTGKWFDKEKIHRRFGYFKTKEYGINVRVFIVGSHKFSLMVKG